MIADAHVRKRGDARRQTTCGRRQAYYKLGQNAQLRALYQGQFRHRRQRHRAEDPDAAAPYGAGDDAAQTRRARTARVTLASPEYWDQLLKSAERTHGLNDHQTLDIYRLRFRTGTMTTADDYTLLAELAHCRWALPAKRQRRDRRASMPSFSPATASMRLRMTQDPGQRSSGQSRERMPAAQKAPTAIALVKLGEDLWGRASSHGRGQRSSRPASRRA